MEKHDLDWFKKRVGKDVVRCYTTSEGKTTRTKVTIYKIKGSDKYMFEMQEDGFFFTDTAENIALEQYEQAS